MGDELCIKNEARCLVYVVVRRRRGILPRSLRADSGLRFALTCILAFSIWCFPVQADTIERGIFAVEYAQGEEELAKETLAILEKGLAEFDEHLPAGKMPIRVIVCSDIATFQRNAGSMGTMPVEGIAESWRSRIVV
ncbi:MAG: hypothetical protein QG656_2316, partial [Candidatus Hydrogenedentes bacterium]|nr:hypothetical protein [Candidatus Hydrogenedentota bacterium]